MDINCSNHMDSKNIKGSFRIAISNLFKFKYCNCIWMIRKYTRFITRMTNYWTIHTYTLLSLVIYFVQFTSVFILLYCNFSHRHIYHLVFYQMYITLHPLSLHFHLLNVWVNLVHEMNLIISYRHQHLKVPNNKYH